MVIIAMENTEMSDDKLLEMAAKAAGYNVRHMRGALGYFLSVDGLSRWNPLVDDGDAFKLSFDLEMSVDMYGCVIGHSEDSQYEFENTTGDISNVRRAIVEVAAYIAKVAG